MKPSMRLRLCLSALAFAAGVACAQTAPTLRPEIAPPLQAAQKALTEKRFDEALARLAEAEAVPGRTPYETYLLQRMRFLAATNLRDMPLTLASAEAALATGQAEPELRGTLLDQASLAAYALKDYAKSARLAREALEAGITAPLTRLRLAQALVLQDDHRAALPVLEDLAARQRGSGEKPPEAQLRLQAATHAKLGDDAGYLRTLEQLIAAHPKADYWAERLARLIRQPGFDERLTLDVLRLGRRVQAFATAEAAAQHAELALRAGFAAEAAQVLGAAAPAPAQAALRERVAKAVAADPPSVPDDKALASRDAGYAFASGWNLYTAGRAAEGIALMERGLQRGLGAAEAESRLRLASALVAGGQLDKARALLQPLRDGGAKDGSADLARLWLLQMG